MRKIHFTLLILLAASTLAAQSEDTHDIPTSLIDEFERFQELENAPFMVEVFRLSSKRKVSTYILNATNSGIVVEDHLVSFAVSDKGRPIVFYDVYNTKGHSIDVESFKELYSEYMLPGMIKQWDIWVVKVKNGHVKRLDKDPPNKIIRKFFDTYHGEGEN